MHWVQKEVSSLKRGSLGSVSRAGGWVSHLWEEAPVWKIKSEAVKSIFWNGGLSTRNRWMHKDALARHFFKHLDSPDEAGRSSLEKCFPNYLTL